jgi:uncharacterized membrane protein YeiH
MLDLTLFSTLLTALTVLATTVMAASAAVQAVRYEFDLFGATVLALVTAVGGGTLRDLLIGRTPVFWINDPTYLFTAIPVGLVTFLLARRMAAGNGARLRLLLYFDAIGLALFTLVGIKVALGFGTTPLMAVVLGCMTGVAGGMFRDILCGLTPSILKEDLYATLSILGGGLYLALSGPLRDEISVAIAFGAMTLARFIVIARSYQGPPDDQLPGASEA